MRWEMGLYLLQSANGYLAFPATSEETPFSSVCCYICEETSVGYKPIVWFGLSAPSHWSCVCFYAVSCSIVIFFEVMYCAASCSVLLFEIALVIGGLWCFHTNIHSIFASLWRMLFVFWWELHWIRGSLQVRWAF